MFENCDISCTRKGLLSPNLKFMKCLCAYGSELDGETGRPSDREGRHFVIRASIDVGLRDKVAR